MPRFPRVRAAVALVSAVFLAAAPMAAQTLQQKRLPAQLSDSVFWSIVSEFSEPEQSFTTYMVSNETFYPRLVSELLALDLRGGAYVGVAPEQNYHYIAALRPEIAFVLDIRRQAVIQHLMYKAIFELSANRADFISLLFSKPRPPGVADTATAFQTWQAFWYIPTDTARFGPNVRRLLDHLTRKHGFPFTGYDSSLFITTYEAFYRSGPNIVSNGSAASSDQSSNTLGNLTSAVDASGVERSFLASDGAYQAVRQLHAKNLVVPIVGDFAGVKALRAIGRYLTEHNTQLTAFYVSNVETYLNRAGTTNSFYQNAATLPSHSRSVLIRGITPGRICNIQVVLSVGFGGC
jgi:hypothetical protein